MSRLGEYSLLTATGCTRYGSSHAKNSALLRQPGMALTCYPRSVAAQRSDPWTTGSGSNSSRSSTRRATRRRHNPRSRRKYFGLCHSSRFFGIIPGYDQETTPRDPTFQRAARNIANVALTDIQSLNTYNCLRARRVFITPSALEQLVSRIGKSREKKK